MKTYSFCKLHYKSDAVLASEKDSTEKEIEEITASLENIFNGRTSDTATTERRRGRGKGGGEKGVNGIRLAGGETICISEESEKKRRTGSSGGM